MTAWNMKMLRVLLGRNVSRNSYVIGWICLAILVSCGDQRPTEPTLGNSEAVPAQEHVFQDVSEQVGIDFLHDYGGTGHKYFTEIVGSGVALFDYDGDGDVDVFLVQNESFENERLAHNRGSRLFRNDSQAPDMRLHFTDVTEEAGMQVMGKGMGAFAADVDNDGWIDLYVTKHGANQLWRNLGDGRFEDVTERSGLGDQGFSVSASFLDFDRDGWLDLYVGNYVLFQPETHLGCKIDNGALDYCGPNAYNPAPDRMYRNLGDGRFEDVIAKLMEMHAISKKHPIVFSNEAEINYLAQLGISYLRQGEQDNCLDGHNPETCIFPIAGGGVHQKTRGSAAAIPIYEDILRRNPQDMNARWLLNIAHMTFGYLPRGPHSRVAYCPRSLEI